MTEEQKQKMAEGRKKAAAKKEEGESGIEKRFSSFAEKTEGAIENLTKTVDKLTEIVGKMIDVSDHRPAPSSDIPPSVREHADVEDNRGFFPPKFRRIIDKLLGPDFAAELEEASGADCRLKITVPHKWDCRVGDEKYSGPNDIRVGLIKKASDLADVESWCRKFAANIAKTHPSFKSPDPS